MHICTGDDTGVLPAHEAAYAGHLECLKLLLKGGRGQTAVDHKGRSVLHWSAMGAALEPLHWLLETGLRVNLTDGIYYVLHCAIDIFL